jgi:hypothetical protein
LDVGISDIAKIEAIISHPAKINFPKLRILNLPQTVYGK